MAGAARPSRNTLPSTVSQCEWAARSRAGCAGRAQAAEARAAAERRAAPLLARLAPSPGPCLVVPGGFERERVRPGLPLMGERVSRRCVHGLIVPRGAECELERLGSGRRGSCCPRGAFSL